MSCLHVFNCDNDLALANFSPGFTPSSTIQMMMQELSSLPLAWADEGDLVVDTFSTHYFIADGKGGTLQDYQNTPLPLEGDGERLYLWGWSPAVCHRLRKMGVSPDLLPTDAQLAEIRRLSSRERAVELLAAMRRDGVCADLQSVYCTHEGQVEEVLSHWPRTILKAPWSGSGKGLRFGQDGREDTLRGWYQRIIQQQGGVVVEPLYDKVHDLAMEFWSDGEGHVTYQGLSLFETHPNGAYSGNLLMPESEKQAWLDERVPPSLSQVVRQWLEARLSALIGTAYRGYLGVDMMVVAESEQSEELREKGEALKGEKKVLKGEKNVLKGEKNGPKGERNALKGERNEPEWERKALTLHPMVEVNLRMTMGMVSILLQRRQPADFHGVFRLDYFADPEAMQRDNAQRKANSPHFRILASGPHYRAYIE